MEGRTELSPGGWSPVTPSLLRPDASVLGGDQGLHLWSQRGPASALASPEPAPTRGLRSAAHPVGRAALYPGPVQTLFLPPLPQDDQSGPQELPRAHLQRARGCRADEGAARWVPRAGAAPPRSSRGPGCPPRSHSGTWSFAHEETEARTGWRWPPRAGTWVAWPCRLLRAGPHAQPTHPLPRLPPGRSAKRCFYSPGPFSFLPVDPCPPAPGCPVVNMTTLRRGEVRQQAPLC